VVLSQKWPDCKADIFMPSPVIKNGFNSLTTQKIVVGSLIKKILDQVVEMKTYHRVRKPVQVY
jgi:hypothetical protein